MYKEPSLQILVKDMKVLKVIEEKLNDRRQGERGQMTLMIKVPVIVVI